MSYSSNCTSLAPPPYKNRVKVELWVQKPYRHMRNLDFFILYKSNLGFCGYYLVDMYTKSINLSPCQGLTFATKTNKIHLNFNIYIYIYNK